MALPYFALIPSTLASTQTNVSYVVFQVHVIYLPSVILATSSFGSLPLSHLSGAPRRRVEATRTAHRGRVRYCAKCFESFPSGQYRVAKFRMAEA